MATVNRPAQSEDWYCEVMGTLLGPMNIEDVQQMVSNRHLTPDDRIRRGLDGDWTTARRERLVDGQGEAMMLAMSRPKPVSPALAQAPSSSPAGIDAHGSSLAAVDTSQGIAAIVLGIVAMVFGVLALLNAWAAITAFLIAGVGLYLTWRDKMTLGRRSGNGLGFNVAGGLLCSVAVIMAGYERL